MKTSVSVEAIFYCSLERAFKTPILGDATQYLVGYGPVPAVVGFKEDETWGRVGGTRIPLSQNTLFAQGGPIGLDRIYSREENRYWEWGVAEFYQPSMGFSEFRGQLWVEQKAENEIHVRWVYTLHSGIAILYPFHWFFTQVFWKGQMKVGIQRMKAFAESDQAFLYT
ncbi:MAG: hypothetical protein AAFR61_11530 [Bacteroidota bacterium]